MSSLPKTYLTPEQYLEIERQAETKSEYLNGEMFAMAGARENHNAIVWNLIAQFSRQFDSGDCRGYPSDMRVRVSATGLYTYPDISVVCGARQFLDDRHDTLLNPTLIVEVLSPSTEAYDRGRKFEHYQSLPSLRQYLLVASDRRRVDLFTRQPDNTWVLRSADLPDAFIEVSSTGSKLALAEIYRDVDFEEAPPVPTS